MGFFDKIFKSEKKNERPAFSLNATNYLNNNSLNFPLPTVNLSSNLDIVWYNSLFDEEIKDIEEFSNGIKNLLKEIDKNSQNIGFAYSTEDKTFDVIGKIGFIQKSNDYFISLFLIDRTNERQLTSELQGEKAVVCWVLIDNYDDLMKSIADSSESNKASSISVIAQIDEILDEWVQILDATSLKYEKDRYLIVFKNSDLQKQIAEKFEFLAKFNQINKEHYLPVTISVGIGNSGVSLANSAELASDALDIALGRGGDQTVVNSVQGLSYFGGRSIEKEKRTKVKLRLVADALLKLIPHNENIFIMGHKFADIDVIGAAAGLCALMRAKGLPANIVLDEDKCVCKNFVELLKQNKNYQNIFISPGFAQEIFQDGGLLIVLDCHKADLVECPELLEKESQLILFDHHRRDSNFIENVTLLYHEPYVSSTSEMIVEILQYVGSEIELSKEEIQCLYAGIVLDTKNFQFKAGVRTFEAASFLKTLGVDTNEVKRMFQKDFHSFQILAESILSSEKYHENVIIAKTSESVNRLQTGMIADSLLDVEGIEASFTLTQNGKFVEFSARSLGEINVQLIMEKMGGGGHITSAGGRIEANMEAALKWLKSAIDGEIEEE